MEKDARLFERIFNPQAMAIIGASPNDLATVAQINSKIKDRLFLVNPNYTEIFGKKCYPHIGAIQAEIDYVSLVVSAKVLPQVLNECIQKGVKAAQIYTAGFSETGLQEGIQREKELQQMTEGRIRLIGPNCFGIYCPSSGQSIVPEAPAEAGHLGVVAQSGSVAESFSYFATTKNLRFSKIVSYGNAIDLDGPDFLDYLADDPETHIIAFYIEGTKNGERLKTALAKASGKKPVIVIKGGLTEQGIRAATSHTASLAGTPEIWRAFFKQTGAIQVESFDEMVNTVMAFSTSPLPAGPAAALISNSGGFSVIQTDLCMRAGIEVPRFSPATMEALRAMVPLAGTSIGNPLDAWPIYYNLSSSGNLTQIIKTVSSDPKIDSLIFQFDQFRYLRRIMGRKVEAHMVRLIELIVEGCLHAREKAKKPVLICVSLDPYLEDEEDRQTNLLMKKALTSRGFPVYSNLDGAVKALARLCQWKLPRPSFPCMEYGV
jgi:acyl-CoA synthetase (NDP forming)